MDMELTYIYHSGFALSGDGFTVIMDPTVIRRMGRAVGFEPADGWDFQQSAGVRKESYSHRIVAGAQETD